MYIQDFLNGYSFDAYDYFGAHIEKNGVVFRVYAKNAKNVSLIGEFSNWQEIQMQKDCNGIYEVLVENAKQGMMYKYKIYGCDGSIVEHSDPYGFYMELRPNSASIIYDIDSYEFSDEEFINRNSNIYDEKLNIYEMHLGAWMENEKDEENHWYNYREIANLLTPYLKEHHYNAVEFMPIAEYPADVSWGYQSTGFFAPTSRYGTPTDLQFLIDTLHKNEIKVIIDFVPVHFAIDSYALSNFDGSPLYEYADKSLGVSEWGSYNFAHNSGIVASFLKSSANYWLSKYHFNGLRMDAISRIIYYNGDKNRPNQAGVDFLKSMNRGLKNLHKNALLIAEDSSDYPKVTDKVENGGLGFTYKWDMGWMNDTLDFFKKSPEQRRQNYHKLSFSMMYYYSEKFLLSLSHDENVHSKATIVQKMYGNYEDKFPQARAFYLYMFTHPGKKLNFMGSELGQLREFDENRGLDFDILKYPIHDAFNRYMKDLQNIYMNYSCLYQKDYDMDGFKWLVVDDIQGVVYSYIRKNDDQVLVCVFNFSDQYHKNYEYKTDKRVMLREILNTNWSIYGGNEEKIDNVVKSICVRKKEIFTAYDDCFEDKFEEKEPLSVVENISYEYYTKLDLPAYSGRLFELVNLAEHKC